MASGAMPDREVLLCRARKSEPGLHSISSHTVQAEGLAPTPTPAPAPSAVVSNLQRPPPARTTAPAQRTSSVQQSPAATQSQKRPATTSPPPQQQAKRSRTTPANTGASISTSTSTSTSLVLHAAQAAIDAAGARRLGTVRARTSSGESLDSMEAEWALPWNDANVNMDVANADPLGGVHLGQKTTRTQNALNELVTSWNE